MLNGLDLFSGIGGISLALREWVRPIAYCEIDPYCQAILLNRQFDGLLPRAPIWDDISSIQIRGNGRNIDIIYGGFPCQDISIAGHGKGLEGERSGLFYEIVRLAKEIEPKFIFLENVLAITCRGGLRVVREIAEMGYDCRWCVISAESIGTPHKRERWFMLAHAQGKRCEEKRQSLREKETNTGSDNLLKYDAQYEREESPPPFYRMDDDVSFRVDRTRALGNAVVPQQAKEAFKILMGL